MLQTLAVAAGVLLAARFLMRTFMAEVYDVIIIKMTTRWYKAVLMRLGCALLLLSRICAASSSRTEPRVPLAHSTGARIAFSILALAPERHWHGTLTTCSRSS